MSEGDLKQNEKAATKDFKDKYIGEFKTEETEYIDKLEAENKRYREALEKIAKKSVTMIPMRIAKEALDETD